MTDRKQLSSLPTARSLYVRAKNQLLSEVKSTCEDHLQTLSVQSRMADSAKLEASCRTWNRLLSSLHPGQFSFLLWAASNTLPTAMNGIYSAVQNVLFVVLHVPLLFMCKVAVQLCYLRIDIPN